MTTQAVTEKLSAPDASTSASGSAAASADKWSDEGRKCLREALVATAEGKFGTAEQFRQCAKLAFESELELRKQQNAPDERRPEQP